MTTTYSGNEPLANKLDDEAIDKLRLLEREMYMAGDYRSEVLREVLDLLWLEGIIEDVYVPNKSRLEHDALEAELAKPKRAKKAKSVAA